MSHHIRVALADAYPVVRLGLQAMLERLPEFRLVFSAVNIAELETALQEAPCDILISDFRFQGDSHGDGMQLIERLMRRFPEMRIVLLTDHDDSVSVRYVLRMGVAGFISKRSDAVAQLPQVLGMVARGDRYVDPLTTQRMMEHMIRCDGVDRIDALSPRESEVCRMVGRGMRLREIAQLTCRSHKTISAQKKSAMTKLGVNSDIELVRAYENMMQSGRPGISPGTYAGAAPSAPPVDARSAIPHS